jgi:hypothetical protein
MRTRGTYGTAAPNERGSSLGVWIVGGLLVGGVVLWAKHQSGQIEKLYSAAGLPHQSFIEDLRSQSSALSGAARAGVNSFRQRLGTRKVP